MKTSVLMRIVGIVCIAAVGLTVWCCGEGKGEIVVFINDMDTVNWHLVGMDSLYWNPWMEALDAVDSVIALHTRTDTTYSCSLNTTVITIKTNWVNVMRGLRELREKYDESK